MNIGLYQSAASLSALERWQDAVSQNITSSQVTGYRERTVEFSAQAGGEWNLSGTDQTDNVTAQFPKATNGVNFKGGDTQPTQRDLDLAIQGEGFFQLQAPDGSISYSRSGEFKVGSDHTLINTAGAQVLSDSGAPITLLPGGKVNINQDGTIVQGQTNLGKVGLVKFSDPSQLQPVAGGVFIAQNGAQPTPVEKPDLLQGYLEASNVAPMREMVDMVLISRSYEASQKVIRTADEQMQKTLEALG